MVGELTSELALVDDRSRELDAAMTVVFDEDEGYMQEIRFDQRVWRFDKAACSV